MALTGFRTADGRNILEQDWYKYTDSSKYFLDYLSGTAVELPTKSKPGDDSDRPARRIELDL